MRVCLDSWAVLAWLGGEEPAMSRVREVLVGQRPFVSWINLGEVACILERRVGPEETTAVLAHLRPRLTMDLPDPELVLAAASIKAHHPLAYADAFAIARALRHDATLLTGDPGILGTNGRWRVEDLRGGSRPSRRRAR